MELTGEMSSNDKWLISSSGRHMFVSFLADDYTTGLEYKSYPGFFAKIHYGNEIKNIKILCIKKYTFTFQSIVQM